jgi:RHS repeat-associated protein
LIRSTGPASLLNPFQFSTKYLDQETGLSYYGHRYYSASIGRWISRDPVEEEDGPNVYAFVKNGSVNLTDLFGAFTLVEPLLTTSKDFSDKVIQIERGQSIINRVRTVIESSDNLQQFMAGVMEAHDTDITDLLNSIDAAKGSLFDNLRGEKSGKKAAALLDDMHHIFPQAKSLANFFNKNGINVDGALSKMNGFLHRYGVHSPGGGAYNEVWLRFRDKHHKMKNNPYYVLGFGFGLFDKIDGKLL